MRELIKRFQDNNDMEVVNYILEQVEVDMLPFRSVDERGRITVTLDEPLKYVAYRIKSMREKMTKKAKSLQAGNIDNRRGILDFASGLSDEEWLGVNYDECHKGNYESIHNNIDEICNYLGESEGMELKLLLEHLESVKQGVEHGKQEIRDNLLDTIVKALEYALMNVDISKSDKEIVSYINKAWLTKYIQLQVEARGLKRVRREGQTNYVEPIFNVEEVDIGVLLFRKTLKHVGGIRAFDGYLNKNQRAFIDELWSIITNDLINNDRTNYFFDSFGKPVLNKRNFSKLFGLSESNFKHKLIRIEDKIHGNFQKVVEKKLNDDNADFVNVG